VEPELAEKVTKMKKRGKKACAPNGLDVRAWLSLFLPRSLGVGVAWRVSCDPAPLGRMPRDNGKGL